MIALLFGMVITMSMARMSAGEVGGNESISAAVTEQMAPAVSVRPFEESDYDAVVALAEENAYWLNGSGYIAELLRSQQCQVYVCTIEDVIAGFIIFDFAIHNESVTGNIRYMAVKQRFRQSGCGRLLLMKAMQILDDHHPDMICLSVRSDNERAIRFYQSMGFGFFIMENQQPNWTCMCRLGKNAPQFAALGKMFHELLPAA